MAFNRILIAISSSPFSIKAAKIGFKSAHALALIYVEDRTKESLSIEGGLHRNT